MVDYYWILLMNTVYNSQKWLCSLCFVGRELSDVDDDQPHVFV